MKRVKMRSERINRGWSLEHTAKQLGITNQAVSLIENGQNDPSFKILVKLEDLFGMDYRDLFNLPKRQLRERQGSPNGDPVSSEREGEMNKALRAAREKAGLTQSQVAAIAGLTEISYQRIEYGQQTPRLKTAFIIARALRSTVDELFQPPED